MNDTLQGFDVSMNAFKVVAVCRDREEDALQPQVSSVYSGLCLEVAVIDERVQLCLAISTKVGVSVA